MKYINVYEMFREYGGPEEGGWWYDSFSYEEAKSIAFPSRADDVKIKQTAIDLRDRLIEEARANGVPRTHSVMYRGGRYAVRIEDHEGHDLPIVRPHYE
jgi:hypothetical protein